MQTVTLKFDVSGQNLIAGDLTRYASNTVNYVKAVFDLDGNWNSFDSVRAVWSTDFECISTVLDSEGVCYVPQEVLKRTGNVMVNLVGSIAENDELTDRLTTYPVVALVINANAKVCGTETAEVTPSQFEQYVAMVVAEVEKVTGMTATAVALPEGSAPTAVYENGVLTLGIPKGDKGETGNGISSVEFNADYSLTFNFTESEPYTTPSIRGERGAQGYGIVSVEKIGTAGLVDTYQVNYEDPSVPPTTFTVTNGAKGDTGNGISSVTKTGTVGLVDTYRITFTNGGHYDFNVTNGAKGDTGATGNGIATIAKTSTSGLVDTYTITFTDGTSTTFEVTNGADGEITEDNLQGSLEDMLSGYSISNGNYDSNNEPYTFRKSGGGALVGVREDLELVGGSVAWNQLASYIDSTHWESSNIYTSGEQYSDGIGSFVGTGQYAGITLLSAYRPPSLKDHKYLFSVKAKAESTVDLQARSFGGYGDINFTASTSWTTASRIFNLPEGDLSSGNRAIILRDKRTSGWDRVYYTDVQLIDLTALFGSTIADYIYTLEQGQAGAGVAFFRKYFPKPYYPYDAGTIKSVEGVSAHKTVGFNAWDEEWELANIDWSTYKFVPSGSGGRFASKNYIPVVEGQTYHMIPHNIDCAMVAYESTESNGKSVAMAYGVFTIPNGCHYIKFGLLTSQYGTTYNNDICINLSWDGERNGEYEPYVEHSYPLDDSLTLRGIPKIANGKLYYDGDTYESDGTVTRKYGIVDLGTLNWTYYSDYQMFYAAISGKKAGTGNLLCSKYRTTDAIFTVSNDKSVGGNGSNGTTYIRDTAYNTDTAAFKTAMSGVYLVYELATPTTSYAEPFESPQVVDASGTEEFVTTTNVPVGNNTKYPPDDLGKLDMLANIPSPPNNNGTYTLEVTVLNGNTTYIWV